jgi:hypothetical protein
MAALGLAEGAVGFKRFSHKPAINELGADRT